MIKSLNPGGISYELRYFRGAKGDARKATLEFPFVPIVCFVAGNAHVVL